MPTLLLVGAAQDSHTDNLLRFERVFQSCGWDVITASHDELVLDRRDLRYVKTSGDVVNIDECDWVWLLGFGRRSTFLDRMQLLHAMDRGQFVNSIDSYLLFQNKAALALTMLRKYSPETIVSSNVEFLMSHVRAGGAWVAKPTAGSFGRDVFELTATDPNLVQILETLTREDYAVVQERVETSREQRWFLTMGTELGAYQKVKTGLRGSIRAEASARVCEPESSEVALVQSIAKDLVELGIRVCAVDIAYPYLLDVNFINPGWFQTMENISGVDYAEKLPLLFEDFRR
ncbi:MAG: hypothetical protein J4G19_07870 [Pseudomonadales bacterium]|nr:hypothetical protein [Pseudomonadales bacterium]